MNKYTVWEYIESDWFRRYGTKKSRLMMTLRAFLFLFTSTGYLFWFRMAQGKDVPFLIRGFSKLMWALSGKIILVRTST